MFGKFTSTINKINLLQTFNFVDMYRLVLPQYIQASDIFSDIPYSYHNAVASVTLLVFLPAFSNIEARCHKESYSVCWSHIHR